MLRLAVLSIVLSATAAAQMPPVGIIDFYGVRRLSEQQIRQVMGVKVGDAAPESLRVIERRLQAVPGIERAYVTGTCCVEGRTVLFVGIQETRTTVPHFRPPPTGTLRLPNDLLQAGNSLDLAIEDAVQRGDAEEDTQRGHSLMHDATARAIQEQFLGYADRDLRLLREVIHGSSDPAQRARAVQVLAYAEDKRWVLEDVLFAASDPSPGVRNNALRAIALIAGFAEQHPAMHIVVPSAPFVDLLSSPIWTDRSKSALLLLQLTATRDPALLRDLRARALPALAEMARWKSRGHAMAPYFILGRVAGMSDDALAAAWQRGDSPAELTSPRR